MERLSVDDLPAELREDQYHYPAELFEDRDDIMTLKFDGSEDIQFQRPVTKSERVGIMARFAVARAIFPHRGPEGLIRAARGEFDGGFMYSIRRLWSSAYKSYGGLEEGDVELVAEELGVYEIVFPLDPERMEAEARHVAWQFSSLAGATFEPDDSGYVR